MYISGGRRSAGEKTRQRWRQEGRRQASEGEAYIMRV